MHFCEVRGPRKCWSLQRAAMEATPDGRATIATWQDIPHRRLGPQALIREGRPQSCVCEQPAWPSFAIPFAVVFPSLRLWH